MLGTVTTGMVIAMVMMTIRKCPLAVTRITQVITLTILFTSCL